MAENIITKRDGGILSLGLNRPEKKNAITLGMYADLARHISESTIDRSVRVLVLHGTNDVFSSGNDIADFISDPPRDESSPVFSFLHAVSRATKPIIAAVNGHAVGIGTTMLLHCDLIYAGNTATFHLPFVALGLCPEAASSLLLPRLAGYPKAAELLLLGMPFDASEALRIGLVNAVVEPEAVMDLAMNAARRIADMPPGAVTVTKSLLKHPLAARIEETIALEGEQFVERLKSDEARAALKAVANRGKLDTGPRR